MGYLGNHLGPTPQSQPLPGQVPNSAGGYAYQLSDLAQLRRFLILGTEGGTYYASERALTSTNIAVLSRILAKGFTGGGRAAVDMVVEISEGGLAPKNDPALLALAIAAKTGDDNTRAYALAQLPRVARIGTHLYHFVDFVNKLGGWGRGTKRAVANWFQSKTADQLAYQLTKYQSRDGWSSRDVLRMSHPKAATPMHNQLYRWAVGKPTEGMLPAMLEGFEAVKKANSAVEVVRLIGQYGLQREHIPTQWLTERTVWEALLPHMKMEALVRNLATMTRVGLFASQGTVRDVAQTITDAEVIRRSKIHPIKLLSGLKTYAQGHGERGTNYWTPEQRLVDALDSAFYSSFGNVEPTGKRTQLALDVSGSMWSGTIAGVPGLTPVVAEVAMCMVTAAVEKDVVINGFTTGYVDLPISPRRRLDDNINTVLRHQNGGGTDAAIPILHAHKNKTGAEAFVVYTDNETWAGRIHPSAALKDYRRERVQGAKLAVVGMTATGFTIADPNDPGMMDVVGFDASAPAIMGDFFRASGVDWPTALNEHLKHECVVGCWCGE